MKIYFTAALSQKKFFGDTYQKVVDYLKSHNFDVQENITSVSFEQVKQQTEDEFTAYYKKMLKNIMTADVVVVEASFPSTLNVGHEISLALEKGKPVIILYKKGFSSYFLSGLNSDKLILSEYDDHNLLQVLKTSLNFAKDQADTRFNFFISPKHIAYLDWIVQNRRIPRSVYLREMIEKDMEANPDYNV